MQASAAALPAPGWSNISVMSAGHFVSDFFSGILPVLLPLFAVQYHISYSECALLLTIFSVACNALQPGIGLWADKYRITYLLPYSIALSALLICAAGWSEQYWLLIAVLLLSGLCSAFFHPLSAGVVPSIYPQRHRGLAAAVYIAGGNLGAALAPFITALFLTIFNLKELIYLSVPGFLICALMLKRHLHQREFTAPAVDEVSLGHLVRSRPFVLLNLSVYLRSIPHCAFMAFLPLLYASLGGSSMDGAFASMIYMIGMTAGGLAAGSLADRFSLKSIILGSYFIFALAGGLFILTPNTSLIAMALLFIAGAAGYAAVPAGMIWSQRLMPRHASFAAALMLGFTFAVGYIFTPFTGFLGDLYGLPCALLYTLLPALLLSLLTLLPVHEPPADKFVLR